MQLTRPSIMERKFKIHIQKSKASTNNRVNVLRMFTDSSNIGKIETRTSNQIESQLKLAYNGISQVTSPSKDLTVEPK